MDLKIYCLYYNGYPIIKNQTLDQALYYLERSSKLRIGIQLNNN